MRKLGKIVIHIVLWIYVAFTLYPILFAVINSFKKSVDVISSPFALPATLQIGNYVDAWKSAKISTYFMNSVYISALCSFGSILLAAMTAYAITRIRFERTNKIVSAFLGLNLMIPGAFLLIPLYFLLIDMKIYNTPLALILPYITFGIPLSTFIIQSFLRSIPADLEEAGVMDGLSAFGLFWKVVLPLTLPALVTTFILTFLGNWNEFIMANFFVTKEKFRTLPVGMVGFVTGKLRNYGSLFASTMYSIVPVIVIYAFLQQKIIDGVTAGSVKG